MPKIVHFSDAATIGIHAVCGFAMEESTLNAIQISEKIGYPGYMPYPSLDAVQDLFRTLCNNPSVTDFKNALKLYRFTPEARTPDQTEIIQLMQTGLSIAMSRLYLTQSKKSTGDIVREYIYKLIPA